MSATVLAIDLGGTKVATVLVDAQGRLRSRVVQPVDQSSTQAPVLQICRLAEMLRKKQKFCAAGVAVPGLVRRDGTVWAPNLRGWERLPLARLLVRALHVPVVVESDRNAAVVGEAWRGAARGKQDVIVLMVGTGIGAGILSGGRLIRGAHELSGCAGWMVITERDQAIYRSAGCLEALTAGPGVARLANMRSAEDVARAARRGDIEARRVLDSIGWRLGLAVANLISLFDPEVIVLGGGMMAASRFFWTKLTRTALSRCQPLAARHVKIVRSKLGGDANLLGVAKVALEES